MENSTLSTQKIPMGIFDDKQYRAICPSGHWYGIVKTLIILKAINVKCPHCGVTLKLMPLGGRKVTKYENDASGNAESNGRGF